MSNSQLFSAAVAPKPSPTGTLGVVFAELFKEAAPRTVSNFEQLLTGKGADIEKSGKADGTGKLVGYRGSKCHRILKSFIIQCGDFTKGDGTGGAAVFPGGRFDDEAGGLALKHEKYSLQMANAGPNTNGAQFCFMTGAAPHLNGKHVVFGRWVVSLLLCRDLNFTEKTRNT